MSISIPAVDKFMAVAVSSAVSDPGDTVNHDVTGLTVALPRAGTYAFQFAFSGTVATNPTTVGLGLDFTGTTTTLVVVSETDRLGAGNLISLLQTTAGTLPTFAVSTGAGSARPYRVCGTIVVSTSGTLAVRFNRASNTISFAAGGGGFVFEK